MTCDHCPAVADPEAGPFGEFTVEDGTAILCPACGAGWTRVETEDDWTDDGGDPEKWR